MGDLGRYRIWIPFFRFCHVSVDKVAVSAPLTGGRSYVFHGDIKIVTIATRLLGITVSRVEVPFANITGIELKTTYSQGSGGGGIGAVGIVPGYYFELIMKLDHIGAELAGREQFWIENPDFFSAWKFRRRAERTEAAIRGVLGPMRPAISIPVTEPPTHRPPDYLYYLPRFLVSLAIRLGMTSGSERTSPASTSSYKPQQRPVPMWRPTKSKPVSVPNHERQPKPLVSFSLGSLVRLISGVLIVSALIALFLFAFLYIIPL